MPDTPSPRAADIHGLWVPAALLVLAVVLALVRFPFSPPESPTVTAPAWATDTSPVRQPHMRPEYQAGVYTYRCSECHKIIASPLETQRTLTQHTEIHLQHGINARCFNCHHRTNRDAFVDDSGNEIPWDQPQLMCAKCHGPVYRDWQHGSHGRTDGYWDSSRGKQLRLRCIQCHDPHRPPFPALKPAPAPHTLRMGHEPKVVGTLRVP
jgi:DNA-directed RNA polymerase subunit RPC12/RpoP